ncbi:hypothetical protein [Streptomyces goshikiensis]|uniref:hypothetical protein n=1 Tax=Streptomyces goshikiensis TaxID=1942 RepID=UPI00365D0293
MAVDRLVLLNSAQPFQSHWRTLVATRASADGIALPVLHHLSRVEPASRTARP